MKHDHLDYCIKKVNDFDTFNEVYKSYGFPPYSELWTEEEIRNEFLKITKNGILFGCFSDDKCIGVLALRTKSQPLSFSNNIKAIYLSDLIVLGKYKKTSAPSELVNFAINYSKSNNYNVIYLRTLKDYESNEFKVFKSAGFKKIPDMVEIVKKQRTRPMKEEECRFFWELIIQ